MNGNLFWYIIYFIFVEFVSLLKIFHMNKLYERKRRGSKDFIIQDRISYLIYGSFFFSLGSFAKLLPYIICNLLLSQST